MAKTKSPIKLSPSEIGFLLECPRCLWLHYKEGVVRPRGLFPSLPGGMDDIFKKYFDQFRGRGRLPPELSGAEGKLYPDQEKLDLWRNPFKKNGGLQAEFPKYNIFLKGAIDDLLLSPDGKYVPFDFKTRGYPTKEDTHEHYQLQLDLYTLLFEKNKLSPADYGYLLFFWPKNYKGKGHTEFKTELKKVKVSHKDGYKRLEEVHKILAGPAPKAHTDCAYCLYRGDIED